MEKDYYATLGVSKDASDKEIKKSFRKLARTFHPDNNPDDAAAEAKFKEINEAYETLSDAESRKEYDHAREMGYFVGGPAGGQQYVSVEDLFGRAGPGDGSSFDLFGGLGDVFGRSGGRGAPTAGRDVAGDLTLSFHEALSGTTKVMNVGSGHVKVKIPQGVADGARVRVKGKGGTGANGGPAGDLYVRVHVAEHPIFKRLGKRDLTIDVPVTFVEAALGAAIDVPTLGGKTKIRVPAGTPNRKTFRVKGKGIETAKGTGDLLVTVEVKVPTTISDEQRDLLESFQQQGPAENPRSHLGV